MHGLNYRKLILVLVLLFLSERVSFADSQNIFALYDSVKILLSQEQREKTIELLHRIIKINPDFKDAYKQFSEYCLYYQKRKLLIQTTKKLITQYPLRGKYYLDQAEALFQAKKIEQAEALLCDEGFLKSAFSKVKKNIIMAKICFFRDKDSEGQKYYAQAISSITTDEDDAAIFNDLIYIITDVEYDNYDSTGIAEKSDFYRAFWSKRDPTPHTEINERIPEHFSRLFYARKYYRNMDYYKKPYTEILLEITSSRKMLHSIDPLGSLKLPRGMIEQKDIDDQGCVYIRHGDPDDSDQEPIEVNDLLITIFVWWKYNARNSQPETWYFFATSQNKYVLLPTPLTLKNLEDHDARFYHLDKHSYLNLIEENREAIEEHVAHETTNFYQETKPIEFPFALVNFKTQPDNGRVECYYGIPLKEFKPNKYEPTAPIEIEKSITVFDKNWLKIDNWQHTDKFATDERNKGWKDILYLNQRQLTLKPGVYNFALQVRDPHSKKIGLYKIPLKVKNYHTDSLQISSVLLATNLSPETPQSLFAKDGVQFTPKFNREFKRNKPLGMYYEVYNLSYNSKGQTDYEMNYSVWRYKKQEEIENPKNKKPVISTGVKQSGSKRDEKVWMSFDMSDHKKGKYVIEILVRDKLTGERVRKLIPVELK